MMEGLSSYSYGFIFEDKLRVDEKDQATAESTTYYLVIVAARILIIRALIYFVSDEWPWLQDAWSDEKKVEPQEAAAESNNQKNIVIKYA